MQSGSILNPWNHCLLKALEIQRGILQENQHETHYWSLIVMSPSCWNLMDSLTWNWSLRKMSWIGNFGNDNLEMEISSDCVKLENKTCACNRRVRHARTTGGTIIGTNFSCLYANCRYICHADINHVGWIAFSSIVPSCILDNLFM